MTANERRYRRLFYGMLIVLAGMWLAWSYSARIARLEGERDGYVNAITHMHREVVVASIDLNGDAQGKIEIVSHGALSLLGYRRGQLAGRSIDELIPLEQRAAHHRAIDIWKTSPPKEGDQRALRCTVVNSRGEQVPALIVLYVQEVSPDGKRVRLLARIIDARKIDEA